MTTWITISDGEIATGQIITNSMMTRYRDNMRALAEDDPSVPAADTIKRLGRQNRIVIGTGADDGSTLLQVGGGIYATGDVRAGIGAGARYIIADGANSGTAGGAALILRNAGVNILTIGNKSAIIGGAYDATPYISASGTIEINAATLTQGMATYSAGAMISGSLPASSGANRVSLDAPAGTGPRMILWGPDAVTPGKLTIYAADDDASLYLLRAVIETDGTLNTYGAISSGGSIAAGANASLASNSTRTIATSSEISMSITNATGEGVITAYKPTGGFLSLRTTTTGGGVTERVKITEDGYTIINPALMAAGRTSGLQIGAWGSDYTETWRAHNNQNGIEMYAILGGSVSGSVPSWLNAGVLETSTLATGGLRLSALSGTLVLSTGAARAAAVTIDSVQTVTLSSILVGAASSTARATLRLPHGTAPTTPTNGDMWTTTAGVFIHINGATVGPLASAVSGSPSFKYASRTFAIVGQNTTSEVSLLPGTAQGSLVFGANTLTQGSIIRITVTGQYQVGSTPQVTFRIKFGSTVLCGTGTVTSFATPGGGWYTVIDVVMTIYSTGASGVLRAQGEMTCHQPGAVNVRAGMALISAGTGNTATVNTTISNTLDVTIQFGTSSNANYFDSRQVFIEHIVP